MAGQGKRVARRPERKHGIRHHLKRLGFTNRLALYILMFLAAGLVGGFYLAIKSIEYNYTGALVCWTVVFTPIGTATSIAISKVVDKNKAENTSGNGDGITFASAQAKGFVQEDDSGKEDNTSPPI